MCYNFDKMSQLKIGDFFKFTKQISVDNFNVPSFGNQALESDRFYEKSVINACKDEKCLRERLEEQKKINELLEKCQKTEEAIESVNSIIMEKNEEIEKLQKMLKLTTIQRPKPVVNSSTVVAIPEVTPVCQTISIADAPLATNKESKNVESQLTFSKFLGEFNDSQMAQLRSLGPTIRDDSTFVSSVMRFLYSERLDCLKNKSVSGRGRTKEEKKEQLTPHKKTVLDEMFGERINCLTSNKDEIINRKKNLNKYVKDAISNINRSEQSKKTHTNACQRLAAEFD